MVYQTTNDFDLTRQDGTYTSATNEFVISNGGTITLPTPTAGEKVGIRALRNDVTVVQNGSIEGSTRDRLVSAEGDSIFVSDGTEWYLVSGDEYFGYDIPDKLGFESGDFFGWSGDLEDWNIITSPVFEGTYAAQSTNSVDTAIFYTGFPTKQGQIISMRMYGFGNNTGSGLLFGVQNGSDTFTNINGYVASRQGAGGSNSVELQRIDNGTSTTLDSTGQSPPENQWTQHLVEWDTNGNIVYYLKDESGNTVETLTANDTTYTSGYIGARKTQGGDTEDMAVDNFEIVGTL